jgi:hypothetical protein
MGSLKTLFPIIPRKNKYKVVAQVAVTYPIEEY